MKVGTGFGGDELTKWIWSWAWNVKGMN